MMIGDRQKDVIETNMPNNTVDGYRPKAHPARLRPNRHRDRYRMNRKRKIGMAIIVSLVLAFGFMIWTFGPMVGPLFGVQRTRDEVIEFIKYHNVVLLLDPELVIKDQTGSYSDWAYAEIVLRRRVAVVLWIGAVVLLGSWARRRKYKEMADNNQMLSTAPPPEI